MKVYEGIVECCELFKIGLAGGDLSTSENGLSVCVSLIGRCEKGRAWTRGGAQPGDVLLVTGPLGGSFSSKKHLNFFPALWEAKFFRTTESVVHACIDITDGLSRDLVHVCDESKCGARIFESKVPVGVSTLNRRDAFLHALADGEDFELLLAVDPKQDLEWASLVGIKEIGVIMPREHGVTFVSTDGIEQPLPDIGYEHVV